MKEYIVPKMPHKWTLDIENKELLTRQVISTTRPKHVVDCVTTDKHITMVFEDDIKNLTSLTLNGMLGECHNISISIKGFDDKTIEVIKIVGKLIKLEYLPLDYSIKSEPNTITAKFSYDTYDHVLKPVE